MNYYDLGDLVQLTVTFYGTDGVTPVDPTSVAIWVGSPDGTQTPYESPIRQSAGVYTQTITVNQVGPWIYRGDGTGIAVATTDDTYFQVRQTVFPVPPP